MIIPPETMSATAISVIRLTIVSDVTGSARGENGESTGIIVGSNAVEIVLDLKAGRKDESTCLSAELMPVIYHCTDERWARTSSVGDGEGFGVEVVQNSRGVVI